MIAFIVVALAMAAIAAAWIAVPLLRARHAADIDRSRSNLAILRDQRKELEADLSSGAIGEEHYRASVLELDRRVLEETEATKHNGPASARSGRGIPIAIALTIPIVSAVLYVLLGSPLALSPEFVQQQAQSSSSDAHSITPEQLEQMVAKLAARLENEPDNAEGWSMLARTYYVMGKPELAVKAYDRAAKLLPEDANLLADYADALGLVQGRSLAGKPLELAQRAIAINPKQWKALALVGTAAFDARDYRKAVEYWERAKGSVPATSPFSQSIDASIAEARQLAGMPPAPVAEASSTPSTQIANAPANASQAKAVERPAAAGGDAVVAGSVSLAPALANAAQPDDTVFIYARAAQGPRMPLALVRKQVKDLPLTFALDDTMAMAPNAKLSDFGEVVVEARVAKSGSATPKSGDLETVSPAVKVGTKGIALVIDRAIP